MTPPSFYLNADDNHRIAVYHWPAPSPIGVLHLLHGMAEHAARYARLADMLNQAGWSLVAHDHRGHGMSVAEEQERGHYADRDGWRKVLADVGKVETWIASEYPALPRVLAGHSMGSFIALAWALEYSASLDGLILSSTDMKPAWQYRMLRRILRFERWRCGAKRSSKLINALSFGAFAKKIPNRKTDFDWLSRDEQEVNQYVSDPLCGHDCTTQLWFDMIDGLATVSQELATLDPYLPVFVFAGDADPMSNFAAGVRYLQSRLERHHPGDLRVDIHEGGRHELLNDTIREPVTRELVGWLNGITRRGTT